MYAKMEGKNRPVLHKMLDSVDSFHESRDKDGVLMYITKYGSTLYIGMDEVWAHYACTFENSDLHFHTQ